MNKRSYQKVVPALIILVLCAACAKQHNDSAKSFNERPNIGNPGARRGLKLFESRPADEILEEKKAFLRKIVRGSPGKCDLGELEIFDLPVESTGKKRDTHTLRNPNNGEIPLAPVIHQYHSPGATVPLIISLPSAFRYSLPKEIISAIQDQDVDHLDLFFVPQLARPGQTLPDPTIVPGVTQKEIDDALDGILDDEVVNEKGSTQEEKKRKYAEKLVRDSKEALLSPASLKPAFWADPLMPRLETIEVSGSSFTRMDQSMQMAIYEPTSNDIQSELQINHLKSFPISVHDKRISGDTGRLNLTLAGLDYGFWSLVITPAFDLQENHSQRANDHLVANPNRIKAAVTLHWVMKQDTYDEFVKIAHPGQSLKEILRELKTSREFSSSPLLKKLENWLRLVQPPLASVDLRKLSHEFGGEVYKKLEEMILEQKEVVVPAKIYHGGIGKELRRNIPTVPLEDWENIIMHPDGANLPAAKPLSRRGLYGSAWIQGNWYVGNGSGRKTDHSDPWFIEISIKDECRLPKHVFSPPNASHLTKYDPNIKYDPRYITWVNQKGFSSVKAYQEHQEVFNLRDTMHVSI